MSDQRVETVKRIYEGWADGDFKTGASHYDDQVLFVLGPEFPDAGSYLGTEALADYTRDLLKHWTRFTVEAERIVGTGDSVLADILQRGVGESSGIETEIRYFQLWSFRGEKVIRIEGFRERADALDAAGIAD
jgi:ketosteroid isomerase-like protein